MSSPVFASGFLLRSIPHGDADLVTTWLTADLGKVTAFARAARGSKRRFAGAISTLTVARLELVPTRGEMWRLITAEVEHSFEQLGGDLTAVAHAAYACELAQELTAAGQPEPQIFADLLAVHRALATGTMTPMGLRWLELRMLEVHGSLPDLDDLVALVREVAAEEDGQGQGAPQVLAALLEAASLGEAAVLPATAPQVARLRDVLAVLIGKVVNRPLQSVMFLQKLNAGLRRSRL